MPLMKTMPGFELGDEEFLFGRVVRPRACAESKFAVVRDGHGFVAVSDTKE